MNENNKENKNCFILVFMGSIVEETITRWPPEFTIGLSDLEDNCVESIDFFFLARPLQVIVGTVHICLGIDLKLKNRKKYLINI